MVTPVKTSSTAPAQRASASSETAGVTRSSRFSTDFATWLNQNGYGHYEFAKNPNNLPSFGGRREPGEKLTHDPVIFIHGNADTAAGWDTSVREFKAQGYQDHELYGLSWGTGKVADASQNYHSKKYLEEVRAFVQAVKEYTGAEKVDVIGHSMGVTLGRKAIKGGEATDWAAGGRYDLGDPLTGSVDTFVGIAGGNRGLASCDWVPYVPTANMENGFHRFSRLLNDMNTDPTREGDHVYSLYSMRDGILGYWDAARTGPIPGEDGHKSYATLNHFESRDRTAADQVAMVRDHVIPGSTGAEKYWPWRTAESPEAQPQPSAAPARAADEPASIDWL
jgi:pimeloyl-ACP methyl ester carboxylesterase